MSRTCKPEWSTRSGWDTVRLVERTARPAGRVELAFAADLALDADNEFDPACDVCMRRTYIDSPEALCPTHRADWDVFDCGAGCEHGGSCTLPDGHTGDHSSGYCTWPNL